MSIGSAIAIYFVVWWLCLFAVLPFGVKSQLESGELVAGSEPGAPHRPIILKKMLMTSVLAIVVTGLLFWGLSNPFIQEYWR